jgi:hypothetical protein
MTRRISLFTLVLSIALATVVLMGVNASVSAAAAKPLIVDDFEAGTITNALGSKTNVFLKAPSKAMVSFRRDTREGKPTTVLMIRYDKKSEGGPNDLGGWCGYYTLLKKVHPAASVMGAAPVEIEEAVYLDASQYSNITFWVKGDKGNERSQEIGKYLPAGKITTDWQKAVVPLDEFFVDYSKLSAIVVSFESDCFPEGMGSGKLYIDDIELE